jgi:hypothetical protein
MLTNLATHRDEDDTAFAVLANEIGDPAAPYSGGELLILDGAFVVDYKPGDLVLLNGRANFHAVRDRPRGSQEDSVRPQVLPLVPDVRQKGAPPAVRFSLVFHTRVRSRNTPAPAVTPEQVKKRKDDEERAARNEARAAAKRARC